MNSIGRENRDGGGPLSVDAVARLTVSILLSLVVLASAARGALWSGACSWDEHASMSGQGHPELDGNRPRSRRPPPAPILTALANGASGQNPSRPIGLAQSLHGPRQLGIGRPSHSVRLLL